MVQYAAAAQVDQRRSAPTSGEGAPIASDPRCAAADHAEGQRAPPTSSARRGARDDPDPAPGGVQWR